MTRKFTFLLMALLALTGFRSWGQETLTVYENGEANGEIPLNTGWIDTEGAISQCIIPASELGAMAGGTISQMKFYIYQKGQYGSIQNAVLECSLGEVATTTITSAITTGLTPVWSGNLNFSDTDLTVTFTTPYQYNGGNLVISFNVVTSSGYTNYTFWGTSTDYQSCFSDQWISTYTFLPKTTFTYTGGASCVAPTGLTASNITATGATISWNDDDAESYDIAYGVASTFDLSNPDTYTLRDGLTSTSVTLSGLTTEAEYKCAVKAHCSDEEESAWSEVITFMPSAKQDLTVNDGTNTNCYIPIYADNAWYSTKSQFIIPAEQLLSMFDGTITDLTFYADLGGFNFGDARWNVYVKEVDFQTLNGLVSTEGMTLVYNGGMAIADNKLHIDFDTDYTYSDNNLLIYFEQTQGGSGTWLNWYGVNTSNNTSYTWYDAYWGESSYGVSFLPKTTIRYSASDNPQTRYAITVNQPEVGGTISASKAWLLKAQP